jgi:hypothetical protein
MYSLVPPPTWTGFLTVRASFELGELEQASGDVPAVAFRHRRVLALWQDAGPGAAAWLAGTREKLTSLNAG